MAGLKSGQLSPPDRIVVSLPPLGVAEQAFEIRDYVRELKRKKVETYKSRSRVALAPDHLPQKSTTQTPLPGEEGCPKGGVVPDPQSVINHQSSSASADPHQPSSASADPDQSSTIPPKAAINHPTSTCQVVVDIMDAWPETFYQVIPKPLRKILGPILMAPMHRSAKRAYLGADKISAVGQSYLDLAKRYLNQRTEDRGQKPDEGNVDAPATEPTTKEGSAAASRSAQPSPQSSVIDHQSSRHRRPSAINHPAEGDDQSSQATPAKPMFLCYHGTDLERFAQRPEQGSAAASRSVCTTQPSVINHPAKGDHQSSAIHHQSSLTKSAPSAISHLAEGENQSSIINHQSSTAQPLHAVYLGSMGQGYDLMTILKVAARWKAEGTFPVQIHFAGTGAQANQLMTYSKLLMTEERVVFHGFLQKNEINQLLLSSDIALVPNKPDSLVACPYKAGEYAAAGLPMISCLDGELNELLAKWQAGCEYKEGDVDSLYNAFEKYTLNRELLHQHAYSARKLAEQRFNRAKTYISLSQFITS